MSLHSLLAVVKRLMMILALFMLVAGKRTLSMKISQHSLLAGARKVEKSETYFSLVEAKPSPLIYARKMHMGMIMSSS